MACVDFNATNTSRQRRRGATTALMAIAIPVLVILAGFAINTAYMELARTDLRVATDAATRAAGRTYVLTGERTLAVAIARDIASRNTVAGKPLSLADSDIVFGRSTRASEADPFQFTPGGTTLNSVRVTGRRMRGSLDGPVSVLLPGIISAGIFEPTQSATSTQVELDIALVVDRSGSMAYAASETAQYPPIPASAPAGWEFCDAAPPDARWRDAANGVSAFLTILSNSPQAEKVALISYNDTASRDVSLTFDYANVLSALGGYTERFCGGSTNIGDAIELAGDALQDSAAHRPWVSKVMVVMTDGQHNTGQQPALAATNAAADGQMIFAITFSHEADQRLMQNVATEGGGQYFHATSGAELINAYKAIAKSLPTLLTE